MGVSGMSAGEGARVGAREAGDAAVAGTSPPSLGPEVGSVAALGGLPGVTPGGIGTLGGGLMLDGYCSSAAVVAGGGRVGGS